MTDIGHDSTDIPIYFKKKNGEFKYNLKLDSQDETYEILWSFLGKHIKSDFDTLANDTHAMVELNMEIGEKFPILLASFDKQVRTMSRDTHN